MYMRNYWFPKMVAHAFKLCARQFLAVQKFCTYHKFLQHRNKNLQAVVRKATGNGFSNLHTVAANRQFKLITMELKL
jgi:hypothetical protein